MNVQLRFFASIREALQIEKEFIHLSKEARTVGDVRDFLIGRGGVWAETLGSDNVFHMACDHKIATLDTIVSEGCIIAFFPPVTGG